MAFMAIIMGLRLLFYILLGFRFRGFGLEALWACEGRVRGEIKLRPRAI